MIIDSGGDASKIGDGFRIIEESEKTVNLLKRYTSFKYSVLRYPYPVLPVLLIGNRSKGEYDHEQTRI